MTSLDALAADMRARAEAAKTSDTIEDLLGLENALSFVPMSNVGVGKKTALGLIARVRKAEARAEAVERERDEAREIVNHGQTSMATQCDRLEMVLLMARLRADRLEAQVAMLVEAISFLVAHACEPEDGEESMAFRTALGLAQDAIKHARALLSPDHKTGERNA